MNDMSEKKEGTARKDEDETLKLKEQPASKIIGERFVPSYKQFDDWGVDRRDFSF